MSNTTQQQSLSYIMYPLFNDSSILFTLVFIAFASIVIANYVKSKQSTVSQILEELRKYTNADRVCVGLFEQEYMYIKHEVLKETESVSHKTLFPKVELKIIKDEISRSRPDMFIDHTVDDKIILPKCKQHLINSGIHTVFTRLINYGNKPIGIIELHFNNPARTRIVDKKLEKLFNKLVKVINENEIKQLH